MPRAAKQSTSAINALFLTSSSFESSWVRTIPFIIRPARANGKLIQFIQPRHGKRPTTNRPNATIPMIKLILDIVSKLVYDWLNVINYSYQLLLLFKNSLRLRPTEKILFNRIIRNRGILPLFNNVAVLRFKFVISMNARVIPQREHSLLNLATE